MQESKVKTFSIIVKPSCALNIANLYTRKILHYATIQFTITCN